MDEQNTKTKDEAQAQDTANIPFDGADDTIYASDFTPKQPVTIDEPTDSPLTDSVTADEASNDTDADPVTVEIPDEGDENNGGDASTEKEEEAKKPRRIDTLFDFAELFVFTLAAVIILLSFVFRHSVVDGDSMMNTLQDGEHLIISDLFYTPERGDIVVFEDYSTTLRKPLIKRIIAIEGDTVKIVGHSVYVNGELLEEDYIFVDYAYPQHVIELTVGEGEVFVMGDHRNASTDSRSFGTVDEDAILGKVILRFYPFSKFGKVD